MNNYYSMKEDHNIKVTILNRVNKSTNNDSVWICSIFQFLIFVNTEEKLLL